MKASEIMTPAVVTVAPATPVQEVARIMTEKHVSGVPVVSADGALIGIVSQSDLLHRAELGTERKRKAWLRFFVDRDRQAAEFVKAHGQTAATVMSRTVVSVRDDAEVRDVASVLDANNIKRVPVIRDGKLVGIISRGDLVRALSQRSSAQSGSQIDDAALQKQLAISMRRQDWLNSSYLNTSVKEGVVHLYGFAESQKQRDALVVLVKEQIGVKDVIDNIRVGLPAVGAF